MICTYADFHLSTFTFILYTCIWIPTKSFLRIFAFFLNPHHEIPHHTPSCNLDLPISRFRDLQRRNGNKEDPTRDDDNNDDNEMCSICQVEFEEQDSVTRLRRCSHTFHAECMEKWLDTCRFTCPLCRSFLLQPSSGNERPHSAPCVLPPAVHS